MEDSTEPAAAMADRASAMADRALAMADPAPAIPDLREAAAALSNMGMFVVEMSNDSYQLLGMAERGMLPAFFARRSRHGTPLVGILFWASGVLLLSTLRRATATSPAPCLFLLGVVPFPSDVPRLKQLGVRGVVTLNEPYETLVPTSLYQANQIEHLVIPTRDYLFAPSLKDISQAIDFIHPASAVV